MMGRPGPYHIVIPSKEWENQLSKIFGEFLLPIFMSPGLRCPIKGYPIKVFCSTIMASNGRKFL